MVQDFGKFLARYFLRQHFVNGHSLSHAFTADKKVCCSFFLCVGIVVRLGITQTTENIWSNLRDYFFCNGGFCVLQKLGCLSI